MKYKKQIATGALAFSLLVSGTSVFAATPLDLGIKNSHQTQKQNKDIKNYKTLAQGKSKVVGIIETITSNGFTINITNIKTNTTSALEVILNTSTKYTKNGLEADTSSLILGKKVIVVGTLDKVANTITAKLVKIVSN